MKIIKRSGTEVVFDIDKIVNAIRAANLEVEEGSRLTDRQVIYAAQNVAEACENAGHTVSVEEIQDLVIGRVLLTLQALNIAIDDVVASDLIAVETHNLVLDQILDLLDRYGVPGIFTCLGNVLRRVNHLTVG